jgi:hypothetical protein
MSVPKQLAKRMKLEKKRLRKRETRLARRESRAMSPYLAGFFGLPGVVCGPVGGLKMSDVMSDFVAPAILDCTLDRRGLTQLYSMAQTAWNIALEPEHRHEAMIEDATEAGLENPTAQNRQLCREFLRWLVTRKLDYFAQYRRPILAFQIDDLEDGGHYLSVVSGLLQ